MTALVSYAYNDYYQRSHKTSTSCSFNGTATTTTAHAPATPLASPTAPKASCVLPPECALATRAPGADTRGAGRSRLAAQLMVGPA
ncbi:hypothetical protein BAE44_0024643 [Dichanthelium oligosanthes]|uniref:X8 domain-containing protein n=1 Tax=Dichanthelium oligosanthes TaxID=888268 RepID=A0A1E5UNE1_9POAL|nr:hypothetical protein BAE44_0024643 [Dichanthelium oligosanthes]